MLTYNDSRLDTNDFLLEHYSTDEERKTLSELETAYGTAQDEYYAMGTNPDATAEDVNNVRAKLLNLYAKWHEYTKQMAYDARHRYIDACYEYAKEDSRRTPVSLIRNDIKDIMCESTAQDYLRFMAYLKMDTVRADTDTTAYSDGAKAKALREVITGKTDIDIPEELTDANKGTLMMYLYMRIEAQVDALTVMGIEYNHREVRQRARELLAEIFKAEESLKPTPQLTKITASVSNLQKTMFDMAILKRDDAIPVNIIAKKDLPSSDYIMLYNNNLSQPVQTTPIDRFVCGYTDSAIDASKDNIALWQAEQINRILDGSAETLSYIIDRIELLKSSLCIEQMPTRKSLYRLESGDKVYTERPMISAEKCVHVSSSYAVKGTFYKSTLHSPFYEMDKESKQISTIDEKMLHTSASKNNELIKKSKEIKTRPGGTVRHTQIKLFIIFAILDMNSKHYNGRKIPLSDTYDMLMKAEQRNKPYSHQDKEKIIPAIKEILSSLKKENIIKDFDIERGRCNAYTDIVIVMPNDKPKKK